LEGFHIYVEHRVDVPDIVGEVLLLPPAGPHLDEPDGDVQNGHVNEYANVGNAEGNAENVEGVAENVEGVAENTESFPKVDGNVGHAERDYIYVDVQVVQTTSKTSKKKAATRSKKKASVRKPKVVGEKNGVAKADRPGTRKRNKMRATIARRGQDSGLADVIAEEELQLSDFEMTDDDEDLFAVKEPIKDDYMDAWWGKFLDSKHHAKIPNKDDEVYHDSE